MLFSRCQVRGGLLRVARETHKPIAPAPTTGLLPAWFLLQWLSLLHEFPTASRPLDHSHLRTNTLQYLLTSESIP